MGLAMEKSLTTLVKTQQAVDPRQAVVQSETGSGGPRVMMSAFIIDHNSP